MAIAATTSPSKQHRRTTRLPEQWATTCAVNRSGVQNRERLRWGGGIVDCPWCHHINEPGAAFCYNCGLPFDEATVSSGNRSVHHIAAYAGAKPSGFWVRLVSFLIDGIVVTPVILLLLTLFTDVSAAAYFEHYGDDTDLFNPVIEGFNLLGGTVYNATLVGLWGATVGKRALGLTVLRTDGSKVGMWRA